MRRVIGLVLLSTVSGLAQPLEGPWRVFGTGGGIPLKSSHVAVRNAQTADVFFYLGADVYHATFSLEYGTLGSGPTVFPFSGGGWTRRLCDVIESDSIWYALAYDTTAAQNRTVVFGGLNQPIFAQSIDEAWHWDNHPMSSGRMNCAHALANHPGGGYAAVWQTAWYFWNWWWGEAGFGIMLFVSSPGWPVEGVMEEGFRGGYSANSFSSIKCPAADSIIVQIGDDGRISTFSVMPFNWSYRDLGTAYCNSRGIRALATDSMRTLWLSRAGITWQEPFSARLLSVENFTGCTEILALETDPIAAASHPDYGIAWLSRLGPGLLLSRVDTSGTAVQPPGVLHWPATGFEIVDAALTISHDGLIVATWSERTGGSAEPSILRLASVGWSTYLDAAEPPVAPQPSAFHLSAYPNPFNGVLSIRYNVPRAQQMELAVFNVLGQKVETLFAGLQMAGAHEQSWTPRGAGGLYFVSLSADGAARVEKVMYLK